MFNLHALNRRTLLLRALQTLQASAVLPALCLPGTSRGATLTSLSFLTQSSSDSAPASILDAVVVGSGMAGLCAAISAKEAGADRVLILEKGPLIGGHSLYSSGSIAAFAPKRADGAGGAFHDSPESFLADALAAGGGSGNRAILQRIVKESGAGLDWLEGMGITFGAPFQAHSGLKPRSFAMRGNSAGRSYILALAMRAQSLGITIAMNARVVHIERERASSDSGGGRKTLCGLLRLRRTTRIRRMPICTLNTANKVFNMYVMYAAYAQGASCSLQAGLPPMSNVDAASSRCSGATS